jgi:hypothetical protein
MCVRACARVRICVHLCMYVSVSQFCLSVCMSVFLSVCLCACACVVCRWRALFCVCVRARARACVHACVRACVCCAQAHWHGKRSKLARPAQSDFDMVDAASGVRFEEAEFERLRPACYAERMLVPCTPRGVGEVLRPVSGACLGTLCRHFLCARRTGPRLGAVACGARRHAAAAPGSSRARERARHRRCTVQRPVESATLGSISTLHAQSHYRRTSRPDARRILRACRPV